MRVPSAKQRKIAAETRNPIEHDAICPKIEQQKAAPLPFKFSNETGGLQSLTPSTAVPDPKYSKIED
jgi:hypothetical protein